MIRIGTRVSPDWLQRPNDLKFLKQIGIDYLDITLDMVDGYRENNGRVDRSSLQKVVDTLDSYGFKIERANFLNSELHPVYMGLPESDRVIENAARTAEIVGEFGIPILGLQVFQAARLLEGRRAGVYSWRKGRGDYEYLHIDVRDSMKAARPPEGAPTREQLWERTLKLYRAVTPVAEEAGVKVAMHGNDPPIASVAGIPQILHDRAGFDRLFSEVPNPNNGITFCVGTRYESGQDVLSMIRHFGGQKRLFHVHFRNVKGTIPKNGQYSEVAPDEGDLNMADVARALHEVSYEGVIDYDHIMRLIDDPGGKSYIAYCVGFMRGILMAVQGPGR
ncbi:MAG: mannonate dehydratase [Chloroflexi bacterium]|nr:mannonate dehydratase [Chloroflexota bacterium]